MHRWSLQESVPAVVLHLSAAGLYAAAAVALGAAPSTLFMTSLTATALGGPMLGLILSMAGRERAGALLLIFSFVGAAAFGIYCLLGLGMLQSAFHSPAGTAWKWAFLISATFLPLLQVKGILDAFRTLVPERLLQS